MDNVNRSFSLYFACLQVNDGIDPTFAKWKCSEPNCTKCKREDGGLRRIDHLKRHILDLRNKEQVICPVCKATFKTKSSLSSHMNVHTDKFQCDKCAKSFRNNQGLTQHMKTHQPNPVFNYKCEYNTAHSKDCHFVTKRKGTLRLHRKKAHKSTKPKECGIDECNDATGYKCKHVYREDPGWPIDPNKKPKNKRRYIDWSKC